MPVELQQKPAGRAASSRLVSLPLHWQVDASVEARAQGITVFAVGVGNEITTSELVSIANRPSSTYVLYAQDYTTIHRIRDSMEQKLCEGRHQDCAPTQSLRTWQSQFEVDDLTALQSLSQFTKHETRLEMPP